MPTGKGPLRTAIEDFLETFDIGSIVSRLMCIVRENDEIEFIALLDNIIAVILNFVKDDKELTALFTDVRSRKHQIGASLLAAVGNSVAGGVTGSLLNSLLAKPTMLLNASIRPALIDPTAMLSMYYFDEWTYEKLKGGLAFHGFNDGLIDDLILVNQKRLDAPQLIALKRRFSTLAPMLDKKISARGWLTSDLEWLDKATLQYGTPQDWIQFAVREATNDDLASYLSLDAEFPESARIEAEKSGLAPNLFKYYWRSHWQLPSAEMGFEFLHRFWEPSDPLYFSPDNMATLLKTLDYSPKWRERLQAISYNLLTRVDLRRIRKAGLVDDNFMYSEARASGYDDFRAKKIVEWWNWENNQDVIDLTKSQIEKGYKTGVLKLREANEALKIAEPNATSRTFLFALWDNDIQLKQTKAEIELIEQEYVAGQYNELVLISKLEKLGLAKTQQSTLLLELDIAKRKSIKHLTRSEIEILYEHNQIDANSAKQKFEAVGYPAQEVKLLMFIVDHDAQKARAKELLDAQREQSRLATSEITNQYQLETSGLNVQIAELNAQIADLKVTSSQTEDTELSAQIDNMILEIKNEIAILNVSKAQSALVAAQARSTIKG